MKIEILLIFCILLSQIKLYAYPSLLLTEEEISCIRKNIRDRDFSTLKDIEKLKLSAMIYCDEDHWCLWVNNKVLRSGDIHKIEKFHLVKVDPDEATFTWISRQSLTQKTFTLRPHQTYIANKQKIVDETEN